MGESENQISLKGDENAEIVQQENYTIYLSNGIKRVYISSFQMGIPLSDVEVSQVYIMDKDISAVKFDNVLDELNTQQKMAKKLGSTCDDGDNKILDISDINKNYLYLKIDNQMMTYNFKSDGTFTSIAIEW